ncbi:sterol desaturase family protein [Mucilaginibacter rubeus]|uniref:Sterol desaturase family protein n=1 Tax=Mucilaginibacter rubeus TaxID=2027860 RepID=A0AAE6JIU3_9SPHI|nr:MULTISPECIES: sterol desaturase family protein [Mucilaginibacter]QEM06476.1 sterol desaturase family protein [Mucilaginibacter rubeus]QEM19062.1 sterol desaturase family protein [Mucilaginibacter gossypii]QTE44397.1 sterol desaturase family protein [Mucilaginibacter rubeus]QTE50996.1 sterol desaturase family protein [Mucilaginibacter rubeus]QTE56080.1 sterol desaturase family protein [Mucilaginibacter rubeus]
MKHQIGPYRIYILLFLLVLVTAEIIWSWKKERGVYELKETVANLTVFAGFQFSKYLFAGYQLAILGFFSGLSPLKLPRNGWIFLLTFFTADFIYYWFHRISHSWKPLWAFHLIHHSAMHMNLTAAYRLNWFSAIVSPLFFIPAALLGMPPDFLVISYVLNLAYQFFMHTEAVGTLGIIEKVMDTPSSHRVHHGSNPIYIDKNFGGVLIIWDRLFKTYQPETEPVNYGLTTGFLSHNPFKLVFQGFIDWFKPASSPLSKDSSTPHLEASSPK